MIKGSLKFKKKEEEKLISPTLLEWENELPPVVSQFKHSKESKKRKNQPNEGSAPNALKKVVEKERLLV